MSETMEKLVFDALIGQYTARIEAMDRQVRELTSRNKSLEWQVDRDRKAIEKHAQANDPVAAMYRAARQFVEYMIPLSARLPAAARRSLSDLDITIKKAENHVDLIPF